MEKYNLDIDVTNPSEPIRIADRIWWVGHMLPDDPFQCHVYLIEDGDQSVLIDPGSRLTFRHTFQKIETIIPFSHIRYFLCHHQDPDIAASLPLIDELVSRPDARVVSHWRGIALLKHYDLKIPFVCIEESGWKLPLKSRELEFIFTPYLHFPGAFCTFDRSSGILFSSDLFGGFTDSWDLVAKDETYYESIRPFHEHYMPSREILCQALCKIEKYPLQAIAPQHGSIIPKDLIPFIIDQLKGIDCGLYLMTQTSTDIIRLTRLNAVLRNFMESVVIYQHFNDVAKECLKQIQKILPAQNLYFYTRFSEDSIIKLDASTSFTGQVDELPDHFKGVLKMEQSGWLNHYKHFVYGYTSAPQDTSTDMTKIAIPLFELGTQRIRALAILDLNEPVALDQETIGTLLQLTPPLSVAIEREIIHRSLENEREKFYNQSIRDPLTNLYTRLYMKESVTRIFNVHERYPETTVGIISLDLDHFKSVNDTYGHAAGDEVLKSFAAILIQETRQGDIPVRTGGEEFAVFMVAKDSSAVRDVAERIRNRVTRMTFEGPMKDRRFSVSCGAVTRQLGESLTDALHRSDIALYQAKNQGRNRTCCQF